MRAPSWRAFLVVGLVLGAFEYGCGRTSLDDGFGPSDASSSPGTTGGTGQGGKGAGGTTGGGQGGKGLGGLTGGGQGGIMAGTIVQCGTTACVAGKQSCCTLPMGNQISYSCVASSDPMACSGGIFTCAADVVCTTRLPKCCLIQPLNVAVCLPAGVPCTPP